MKSPKRFLIQSGVRSVFSEAEHDYRLVIDDYRRKLAHTENKKLIKYQKDPLEELFDDEPPQVVQTLLEISIATYAADRLVSKGPTRSALHTEDRLRSRQVLIICPVDNVELWNKIAAELSHMVSFISRDNFQYRFVESLNPDPAVKDNPTSKSVGPNKDSVALFSGGLDSLAGYHHLTKHRNPQFVTINHGHNVGHIVSNFEELFDKNLLKVGVDEDFRGYESTQFTRSFMYLSIASAVAVALDADTIFIPENGILARFPMLQHGWVTTRTAHPSLLSSYNRILNHLFPERGLDVRNPFEYSTKTEVVDKIPDIKQIFYTRTCPHPRELSRETDENGHPMNCGLCIPCLVRQIALITSGHSISPTDLVVESNPLLEFDYSKLPEYDTVPTQHQRQSDMAVLLLGLMRFLSFANFIQQQPSKKVISRYPEAANSEVYRMYQRFSRDVFETVEIFSEANPSLADFVTEYLGN